MSPFVVFIIIIVVIWTLSGIATAINKQKEQERRRQLRMQLERSAATERGSRQVPPPFAQPAPRPAFEPRQISEGIATRFPDVLLPPDPPRRVVRAPQPPPLRPGGPRGQKKQKKKSRQAVAAVQAAAPPPGEDPVENLVAPAPPVAPVRAAPTGTLAPAISRWLKPETLRQQFILTEIFQPPIALRERREI